MAKRRGNHEGSIHKLPSGSWRVQTTLNGHRLNFTAKTRQEVQEWLKKTIGQIDDGMTYASTKITVEEYMAGWISSTKASKRPRTWQQYEQTMRNHILPHLGKIKIRELRPEHIQRLYDHLLAIGTGIYTILKIHSILSSALSQAVKMGVIVRNPVSLTMPPKEPSEEMKILDESQVSQLQIAAAGSRLEALIHLALATGMREMELLGLRWTDLDWVRKTLKIERQLARPEEGPVRFAPPKTKSGRRTLTLGGKTIEVLRHHYDRQHAERKAAGEKWQENGLIFPNSLGGPIHPHNLLRDYRKLLQAAGLPRFRFHDLRHTAASLMLNHGIPPIVVSRRLGHARASITLDVYGHLLPSMQNEAAEIIDELITPIPFAEVMSSSPTTKPHSA